MSTVSSCVVSDAAQVRHEVHCGEFRHWYVVQSKAGQEALANSHLSRQGYRSFLPTFEKNVRHARKVVRRKKPLFPGYLFVELNLEKDSWYPINSTIGVSRVLSFGGQLAQLPFGLVERMIELSDRQVAGSVQPEFTPGDRVRVLSGAFDNWIGDVVSLPDTDRVTLLVSMLSRKVPVTVRQSQLQKIG